MPRWPRSSSSDPTPERLFEPGGAGRGEATRRVVLLVAYDGSAFHGFAVQRDPAVATVGGALDSALSELAGRPVAVTCAGRTDAGVHASGQVAHADLPAETVERLAAREAVPGELSALARSLTRRLGPALAVTRALQAPEGFDARRSAVSRRYRYELLQTAAPDPLACRTTWHVGAALDLNAMRLGADALLGEHDFSAFCKRPPGGGPQRRRVTAACFTALDSGRLLRFEIEANAFCHHMVRAIVAALVGVGRGRRTAADLLFRLRTGEHKGDEGLAPAAGLRLLSVRYPEEMVPGGVLRP